MRWLTLHLELVTPCFLAGSENQGENKKDLEEALKEEGLRPASLIGQWRYWLRAGLGATGADWKGREEVLFGSQHDRGRQGCVWVRPGYPLPPLKIVSAGSRFSVPPRLQFQEDEMPYPVNPLGYLLGQGLLDVKTGLTRPALQAGQVLPVQVAIRPVRDLKTIAPYRSMTELWKDLRLALWLWQTFGGLGARCRRGWGSFTVKRIEGWEAIDSAERPVWQEWFPEADALTWTIGQRRQLLHRVKEVVRSGKVLPNETGLATGNGTDPMSEAAAKSGGEPDFSHLGSAFVHLPEAGADTWEAALAQVGLAMLRARSNARGRRREPKDLPRVQDHDEVHEMLHRRKRLRYAPFRAAFGLPHNYFFGTTRKKATFEGTKERSRRASPVLIHVARVGNQFVPAVLWLKAKLTEGDIVSREHAGPLAPPDWSAVVEFFQELTAPIGSGLSKQREPALPSPTPVVKPTPPSIPPKPLNKGQTVKAVLRLQGGRWQAEFPAHGRTGVVTNFTKVPAGTADGAAAEFYIEEASKTVIRARLERLVT